IQNDKIYAIHQTDNSYSLNSYDLSGGNAQQLYGNSEWMNQLFVSDSYIYISVDGAFKFASVTDNQFRNLALSRTDKEIKMVSSNSIVYLDTSRSLTESVTMLCIADADGSNQRQLLEHNSIEMVISNNKVYYTKKSDIYSYDLQSGKTTTIQSGTTNRYANREGESLTLFAMDAYVYVKYDNAFVRINLDTSVSADQREEIYIYESGSSGQWITIAEYNNPTEK
ncbi:MAG: hypothetical protein LIO46_00275, partial [Clostridiales bacterium]|nr:hypothetical protein [Clostridiales bacterium]